MSLLVAVLFANAGNAQNPKTYLVTVDTSSQQGQTGYIDMQFNAGPLMSQAAYVNVTVLFSDATLNASAIQTAGNVTGNLGTGLTLVNGPGSPSSFTSTSMFTGATTNQFTQAITFGARMQFAVTVDGPAIESAGAVNATSMSTFGLDFLNSAETGFLFTNASMNPQGFAGTLSVNLDGSVSANAGPNTTVGALTPTLSTANTQIPVSTSDQTATFTTNITNPSATGGIVTYKVIDSNNNQIGETVTSGSASNGVATATFIVPAGTAIGTYIVEASYSGYAPSIPANPGPFLSTLTILPTVSVTVATSPANLAFSVDGTSYSSSQTFTWAVGSIHTIAIANATQGSAGNQYSYTSWSDGGAVSHQVTTPTTAVTYTANFATSYLLTANANQTTYGTVSATPGGTGGYYPSGTTVTVTATPNTGYNFQNWSGNVANINNASTTVTMNQPQTITANFAISNVNVTVNTAPAGLMVSIDGGAAQSAPVSVTWQVGTNHTISTSSPQGSSGTQFTFANWSDGGAISHSVTASASTTSYVAAFNTSYLLSTAVSPAVGGSVNTSANGTNGYYPAGTVVSLTAVPNQYYAFTNWTGNVVGANNSSTTITMNAPQTVTANFALTYTNVSTSLNVTSSGLLYNIVNQGGTVTFTITNTSSQTITGPLQLVLTLPSGVTAVNSIGTFQGNPYWSIPSSTNVAPNASVTIVVQLSYSPGTNVQTTPSVYSGTI